ncbi:hypothetical protein CYR40_02120 [Chimaeribacter arupi]|uniref:hypothetical protein n=1 Tax=Chimaeribacter arupi TaxID=2060066 RepID=UPI000C7A7D1F|nr:hypothetical protein [Chimaeribacter arupi]PLR50466.1 hypothetical protein CYR40_02120 [Chimaeribacter arupi]
MQIISPLKANEIVGGGKPNTCKAFTYISDNKNACVVDYRCYNKHGNVDKNKTFIEYHPKNWC